MSTFNNFYSAMNCDMLKTSNKKTDKKIKLKMNNQKIHSIQELRDNFDAEVILKKYHNGKLVKWLQQHYYDTEAQAICNIQSNIHSNIHSNKSKLLEELCSALGVSYSPVDYMSDAEQSAYYEKLELLKTITSDANILNQAHLVAMNQDDLALLLNQSEPTIYLCNNTFSIPITVDNQKYIGIGTVSIENAFTNQQYNRAGIEIENIALPDTENPDTINLAQEAAKAHGYDDFGDYHSKLTTSFHEAMKVPQLSFYQILPYDTSSVGILYNTRSACYTAAKSAVQKAYTTANAYFNPESKQSLAKECAKYYSEAITGAFEGKLENLENTFAAANATDSFEKLCKLINKSKKKLKKTYEKELLEDAEFYEMYQFDYFMEQVEIEELEDSSFADDDSIFEQLIEVLFSDGSEYMISDIYSPISEMESDLEDHITTFYKFAHREYLRYVAKIEKVIEDISSSEN